MTTIDYDPLIEDMLVESRQRRSHGLPRRELLSELALGTVFLVVVGAMIALLPAGPSFSLLVAVLLIPAHVLAQRVEFEVGAGTTNPTQLVLVPMLLLLPVTWVPLLVMLSLLIARVPDVVGRRESPDRMLLAVNDSWHAVGPALVLAAAGAPSPELSLLPLYGAALLAQFGFDTVTGIAREWLAFRVPPSLQARVLVWVMLTDAALAPIGLLAALAAVDHPAAVLLAMPLVALLAGFARDRRRQMDQAIELSTAYRGTALLMSDMLEADDQYTGGEHSDGVVALATVVATELGLEGRELRNLEFGALLHDVGKILVPKEILNKPGRLTDEEYEIVKRHPIQGQELLDRIGGVLAEVGAIVRSHHERWDGHGYPDGLAGERIPLASRVICVCDAYNAMTTDRPYRAALSVADACAELERCAGTQFDPTVVAVLARALKDADRAGQTGRPRALELVLAETG